MPSLMRMQIAGHLGKDPELKYTNSGKAVCNFSVASNYGKDENKKTEWTNVVAWEKQAQLCAAALKKGMAVFVEGRKQTEQYEKDGAKQQTTKLVADHVFVWVGSLPSARDVIDDAAEQASVAAQGNEDLPF